MIRRLPPALRARLTRPGFWASAWVLWFIVLCILSSMSQPGPQIHIAGIDKVQHTVYFAAGGTCLALALAMASASRIRRAWPASFSDQAPAPDNIPVSPRIQPPGQDPAFARNRPGAALADGVSWGKTAFIVILTGAAVGWLDEWHQSFTPGRFGLDQYDWLADVLGSALALPLARRLHRALSATEERT